MTDYFALLDEPRRPWVDTEALKAKFLARAADHHPDRVQAATETEQQATNQRYAELNAAYNCLREPKDRLLHLLELERGVKPEEVQNILPATMDLFLEVSRLCRKADAFLAEKAKTTSPLLKVRRFEEGMALTEQLNVLRRKLNEKRAALTEEMKNLNKAWASAPPVGSPARINLLPCSRLEHIYREVSYLTRWSQQIQERVVQLSF